MTRRSLRQTGHARCRAALAGREQRKAVHFVAFEQLPGSTTGKIERHEPGCGWRAMRRTGIDDPVTAGRDTWARK